MANDQGLPGGKALAELLGVTYETLRAWTADGAKIAPNRNRAIKIAEVLKTTPEVVMHGAAPPPRQPDAEALADAFEALPVDSEMALTKRRWLYQQVMAQIAEAQREARASAPAPEPAAPPIVAPLLPQ